jgi:hypothetical protein
MTRGGRFGGLKAGKVVISIAKGLMDINLPKARIRGMKFFERVNARASALKAIKTGLKISSKPSVSKRATRAYKIRIR